MIMDGMVLGIELKRLLIMRDCLFIPSGPGESASQIVLYPGIGWFGFGDLFPFRDCGIVLTVSTELNRLVEFPIHVDCRRADLHEAILRNVYKLWKIYGPVGGGRILDQNRRTVIALLVNMRKVHLRVRGTPLLRK